MATLDAGEAAGMCSAIVELRELRMLARSRTPGLLEFLRAFLLHRLMDGCCRGRRPPFKLARPPSSRYLHDLWFAYFLNARRAQACDCG